MSKPRMCPHCRAFVEPKVKICPYCDGEIGKPAWERVEPEAALRGLVPQSHFTTLIILLINFGIFAATLVMTMKRGGGGGFFNIDGYVLHVFGAKETYFIVNGEWWRLVTAGFLHGGVFHILMNSWVLYDLGAQVEAIFGTARYLVLYLVSSVFGFTLSMFWSPQAPSVGASAAACGLIGAMLAYGYRSGRSFVWSFYLRWIILIVLIGILFPGIDNAAHLGGLAGGFVLGYFAGTPRLMGPVESFWKAAAGASLAVVGVSFMLAYLSLGRMIS